MGELEVGGSLDLVGMGERPVSEYDRARVLVRMHGDPVGFVEVPVPAGGLTPAAVAEVAWSRLGDGLRAHLVKDGIGFPDVPRPELVGGRDACPVAAEGRWEQPLSVVVCTRNRADLLAGCLGSLQRVRYGEFEVVVVDNAPEDDSTRARVEELVGADPRFRYVCEPVAGLSRARNRGLTEASSSYVAFTDDDVIVDPWWLHGVARGFGRDPEVGCVTGLVPSASLDTPAQRYFDQRLSWSERFQPRVYGWAKSGGVPRYFPFNAGVFGTGASMAVDRDLVIGLGGFDEALGPGSPARNADDLDMFVRVVRAGRALVYEPSAMVWHFHREDASELREQMRSYGVGMGAFVTKQLGDRAARSVFVRLAPRGAWDFARSWRHTGQSGAGTPTLAMAELWGIARGPVAYRKARRAVRRRRALTG